MSELAFPITLDDMIVELDAELAYRRRAFPRMQQSVGLAARNRLDRRFQVMEAIRDKLLDEREVRREKAAR